MSEMGCSQISCQVGSSGLCLEGFDPVTTCPYFGQPGSAPDEGAPHGGPDLIDLPSGEALTEREATETTQDDVTKVVIIAGPTGSGKTTILTSLYEAFLDAPF